MKICQPSTGLFSRLLKWLTFMVDSFRVEIAQLSHISGDMSESYYVHLFIRHIHTLPFVNEREIGYIRFVDSGSYMYHKEKGRNLKNSTNQVTPGLQRHKIVSLISDARLTSYSSQQRKVWKMERNRNDANTQPVHIAMF